MEMLDCISILLRNVAFMIHWCSVGKQQKILGVQVSCFVTLSFIKPYNAVTLLTIGCWIKLCWLHQPLILVYFQHTAHDVHWQVKLLQQYLLTF